MSRLPLGEFRLDAVTYRFPALLLEDLRDASVSPPAMASWADSPPLPAMSGPRAAWARASLTASPSNIVESVCRKAGSRLSAVFPPSPRRHSTRRLPASSARGHGALQRDAALLQILHDRRLVHPGQAARGDPSRLLATLGLQLREDRVLAELRLGDLAPAQGRQELAVGTSFGPACLSSADCNSSRAAMASSQ